MTKVMKASDVQNNLFKALNQVAKTHEPIVISSARHNDAVLISLEDYNAIKETIYLNSIPNLANSLIKAKDDDETYFSKSAEW